MARPKGSGGLYQREGSQFWWIKYYRDGKYYRESTKFRVADEKGKAKDLLLTRLGGIQRGLPITPTLGKVTFEEAAKAVLDDFTANGKRSSKVVKRRIDLHLSPYFGAKRRMSTIGTADVVAFVAKRQADKIMTRRKREDLPEVTKTVSNAEINRELQVLKRMFNLAVEHGRLLSHMRPTIKMLAESPARSGFFEPEQLASVLRHLPAAIRPVIRFAAITGWRVPSEVLPLEWHRVDFQAGEVRLDPGTTKNGKGRVFPLTAELRTLLLEQQTEHDRLKTKGKIVPWVFHRDGKRIKTFQKPWKVACVDAGCPGRIPHDLRRTAVRALVRAGVPETVAMMMTGHKTRSVFMRYDITSANDLRAAARLLDARDGVETLHRTTGL
jgi:integrase